MSVRVPGEISNREEDRNSLSTHPPPTPTPAAYEPQALRTTGARCVRGVAGRVRCACACQAWEVDRNRESNKFTLQGNNISHFGKRKIIEILNYKNHKYSNHQQVL